MWKHIYSEKKMHAGNWNILVPAGKENKLMMSLVTASEKDKGQTESAPEKELEMWWRLMAKSMNWNFLERNTLEGDSPVSEIDMLFFKRVGLPGLDVWIGRINC